jgi:hypothetical protein
MATFSQKRGRHAGPSAPGEAFIAMREGPLPEAETVRLGERSE